MCYNPETYTKINRNGKEVWVYDWGKSKNIDDFNYMLDRWGGVVQRFYSNDDTKQYFLIDKQEKYVMEIVNPTIKGFFYNNVYMADINETFIDLFINIGGFQIRKWE